ncbi:MAG: glycosyltransferase family 4 protein [Verrucomicrobiota bacterium]
MRITLASETFFPQVNGVSRTLEQLVAFLNHSGDQVQLLAPCYKQGAPQSAALSSMHAYPAWQLPFYREIHLPLCSRKTVQSHIEQFNPDVVHVATEGPLGYKALRIAKNMRLPLVTSYHTNFSQYMQCYGAAILSGGLWKYLRWFHNSGECTLCPSDSIREILAEKRFNNLIVWGRGVDCQQFNPDKRSEDIRRELGVEPGEQLLAYAGRVANEKNLTMLIDAFQTLPETVKAKLAIIGDGPIREKLRHRSDQRILYPGYKHGEELATLYASCDLFVFPSLTETFGNVMLEAMAAGLPVLAYNVPGPKDVVRHGQTGALVDEVSSPALADALLELLAKPHELAAMATAARTHAESQTWAAVNNIVRNAYLNTQAKTTS